MKVSINDGCISCGLCVELCPEVFDMPDDGKAFPIVDVVPEYQIDCAREAADSCPTESIILED